ncbi:hypothetical protein BW723_06115 [Polaribacter reichenbachii]|uniref:Uncharacterized protein n=1 Tax=Polaribacter reichenbachii TaxID=996801 RepID=A0A1B8TYU1_9FLAO|nr:hypothetical protein [Polaribacter reichenbachii]APZ45894.1 hypothetical protein BW723_06115 [Polaribacter reichenbachii]AUC19756.1 hypothetical protein BTO17_14130 [Polaribacter reichenbachii]OBY64675.1 hypothetical protein LPB301_09605 [Polaribacter reichenbachii]
MNEEHINNLIKKYKAGESSLQEEKLLFDTLDESNPELKSVAAFVQKNSITAPDHLNDKLWNSFEKRNSKSKRLKIGIFSAAASIVLLVTLYINMNHQNKLSNSEKQALLNEAKNMFADVNSAENQHRIIVESDLVVVYSKTK